MRPEERNSTLLAHVAIVIAGMYIVFYLIDRVNRSMEFISNDLTKGLLLVQMLISIYLSVYCIRTNRRNENAREHRRRSMGRRLPPRDREVGRR